MGDMIFFSKFSKEIIVLLTHYQSLRLSSTLKKIKIKAKTEFKD